MNTTEQSMNDIAKFFSQIGYTWKGQVFRNDRWENTPLETDFGERRYTPTLVKLYKDNKSTPQHVVVTPYSFKFYDFVVPAFGDIDAGDYEVTTNYTAEWVYFLLSTYGEAYQSHLLHYCQQGKLDTMEDLNADLRLLKAKRHNLSVDAKNKLIEYKRLEDIATAFNQENSFNK